MEHLLIDLKENLILRKKNELKKVNDWDKVSDRDLLLISSGKLFELDFMINVLNEILQYINFTKIIKE